MHTCSLCCSFNFSVDLNIFQRKFGKNNSFHMIITTNIYFKRNCLIQAWAMNHYQNYVLPAVLISLKEFHLFKWEKGADLLEERRERSFKVWDRACHADATFHEEGLCVCRPGSPLPADWWLSAGRCGGPPRGCECRDEIRKMQWPQTEGRWIPLGFSFGWISR